VTLTRDWHQKAEADEADSVLSTHHIFQHHHPAARHHRSNSVKTIVTSVHARSYDCHANQRV